MIRISYAGAPTIRLATSPSWELLGYASAILRPGHAVVPDGLLQRWRARARRVGASAVWEVLAHPQFVPRFLVPDPVEPFGTISRELDRIGRASPDEIVADLRIVQEHVGARGAPSAILAQALGRPSVFRGVLVEQMRALWDGVVAPGWAAHLAMLEGEVLSRGRQLALDGPRALLDGLHDDAAWRGDELLVDCGAIDLAISGAPDLLLVPSVFAWPKIFVSPPDRRDRTILYYPARGAATLFLEPDRRETIDAPDALGRLLGENRARILTALDEGATTSDLARRFELSAGGVSQHLRRLSALGLVRGTRVGRHVYYERVARGDDLIELFRGPGA